MGLYSGSISVAQFRILGTNKGHKLAEVNELLDGYRAGALKLSGINKEEYIGWVKPPVALTTDDDLEDEGHWDLSDCHYDDGFFLRLRHEKRRVPSTLLQLVYKREVTKASAKAGDKPLTRSQKKQIKDTVKRDLLAKCLPQINYIDGFWRDDEQMLLIFSTSKGQIDTFTKHFRDCFLSPLGLDIIPLSPPLLGLTDEIWDGDNKALKVLDRLSMTLPVAMVPGVGAH